MKYESSNITFIKVAFVVVWLVKSCLSSLIAYERSNSTLANAALIAEGCIKAQTAHTIQYCVYGCEMWIMDDPMLELIEVFQNYIG